MVRLIEARSHQIGHCSIDNNEVLFIVRFRIEYFRYNGSCISDDRSSGFDIYLSDGLAKNWHDGIGEFFKSRNGIDRNIIIREVWMTYNVMIFYCLSTAEINIAQSDLFLLFQF